MAVLSKIWMRDFELFFTLIVYQLSARLPLR